MRYVIEQFWVWTAVSAVLGLVVGWLSQRQSAESSNSWLQAYVALAVVGAGVVYSGVIRGTAALWFETLVLFGVAYLVGCIIGTAASRLAPSGSPAP
jgi:hypothetical protein